MSWIITYLASSTLLMLIAISIERRLRPEWREAILWLTMAVPVVAATIRALVPVEVTPAGFAAISPFFAIPLPSDVLLVARADFDLELAVMSIWFSVGLILIARDVLRHRRLVRALDREPVDRPSLVALASLLGLRRHIAFTESATLPVPIAMGSAEICLPSALLETSTDEELEPILAHELAHLRRHDPRLQQIARLISVTFWWQPLNRIVARKLAAVAELRTDDLCATVVEPTRLARTLVQFAERVHTPQIAGMPAFPAGLLRERVSHLLSDKHAVSPVAVRLCACCVIAIGSVVVAPRFAIISAQLPAMFEPLVVRASQINVTARRNGNEGVARTAARPIARKVIPGSEDVLRALSALLVDSDKHVRYAARESLRSIGTPESLKALANDRFADADARKENR